MEKKFTPSLSTATIYAREFLQRLAVNEKLESNQKYSHSRIEEITYNELRNYRRELFENPTEWRIAIMKQSKEIKQNEQLKETEQKEISNQNLHTTDQIAKEKSIANGLNPHDRDEDESIGEIKIILPIAEQAEFQPPTETDAEKERPAPITEGRVNINCISKEDYHKKLEEEYIANLQKRMLR
jgi:hypothetical protein